MSLGYSAIALPQLKPYMDDHGQGDHLHDHNNDHTSSNFYRPFTIDDEGGSWIGKGQI